MTSGQTLQNPYKQLRPLLFIGLAAVSITPVKSPAQTLPLKTYTQQDGLVAGGVKAIIQDSRGYLWIGTGEGLSSYDGYEFTNYRSPGEASLHMITGLCESRFRGNDTLWVAALPAGVVLFSKGVHTPIAPETWRDKSVEAIVEDSAGNVWCATNLGLYRINGRTLHPELLSPEPTRHVAIASDQTILVLTTSSLVQFSLSGQPLRSCPMENAATFCVDGTGGVWVAMESRQLLRIDEMRITRRIPLPINHIEAMATENSTVWIAGLQGVVRVQETGGTFTVARYSRANGFAGDWIQAVMVDRERNIWFGTPTGLQRLRSLDAFTLPISRLAIGRFYKPLAVDDRGRFWAVVPEGVVELSLQVDGTLLQRVHTKNELGLRSAPTCVTIDSRQRMWIADESHTLYRFSLQREGARTRVERERMFTPRAEQPHTGMLDFLVDSRGNIWCSLYPIGVAVFDSTFQLIRLLTKEHGVPDPDIRAMVEDREHRVWMGGVKGGIAIATDPRLPLTTLKASDGLPDERVRSFLQDHEGRMLIGTRTGGLVRYDGSNFSTVTVANGLVSDCVWDIAEDDKGHYWLATQLGLQSVDTERLSPLSPQDELVDEGPIACVVSKDAVAAYRYGSIFLVRPQSAAPTPPPPVYITGFLMNGLQAPTTGIPEFPFDRNTCLLEFTGISFQHEKQLHYSYRLLKAGSVWSAPSPERRLMLPNLSPGDYTLQVKAVAPNGIESKTPAEVAFVILPPLWRTWWAYSLYAILLLGAAFLWRRREIARIQQREREEAAMREAHLRAEMAEQQKEIEKQQTRIQIARDLHDEVGSTLSSITFFAEAMKGETPSPPEASKFVSLISESSAHAREAMSDIIWSIDPTNDSWETIVAKLQRYASDLFESRGLSHTIEMPASGARVLIDPQRRRHFWLLFKEIVTNAAKHSRCTQVDVRLIAEGKIIVLSVRDNGSGFDPDTVVGGNGLGNIRTRAGMLSADAVLKTRPGQGTEWVISFEA